MMHSELKSQSASVSDLARVVGTWKKSGDPSVGEPLRITVPALRLQVCEEKSFGPEGWLDLGSVTLRPSRTGDLNANSAQQDQEDLVQQAIRLGYYEWAVLPFSEVLQAATSLVESVKARLNAKDARSKKVQPLDDPQKNSLRRGLEAVAHVAARVGLTHPIFDPGAVVEMPFRRATTVIADTSAIYQGAVDFVARYLHPMARFKIPAVVHMEILTQVNNCLNYRRGDSTAALHKLLSEQVRGMGGQRVLLRLELQSGVSVERPRIGPDPLRGIVSLSPDHEDKNLNIQHIHRSYADRLIFETALQHQERLHPGHPVMVLTSDEGLARMSLAEGIRPLFFRAVTSAAVFGTTLPGVAFHPFQGPVGFGRLINIPLTTLLWELAVTFGGARLYNPESKNASEIWAIGEHFAWQAFHSADDLLWVRVSSPAGERAGGAAVGSPEAAVGVISGDAKAVSSGGEDKLTGFYRFRLEAMLQLIRHMALKGNLDATSGAALVGLKAGRRFREYVLFLASGEFIESDDSGMRLSEKGRSLWESVLAGDTDGLAASLDRVPSFNLFSSSLKVGTPLTEAGHKGIPASALHTYSELAEVSARGLRIPGEGIFGTPARPSPAEFAQLALKRYDELKDAETDFASTGRWLEALVRQHGIHPLRSRRLLEQAREGHFLGRYAEGSTPDTEHERHRLATIELTDGTPTVRRVALYDGSFLIPGRASVLIRLEDRAS